MTSSEVTGNIGVAGDSLDFCTTMGEEMVGHWGNGEDLATRVG